jgi:HK97 family phage prohead protease/HK97 family phage major capsid protein
VLTHAHAVLHVKGVDAEARTITGIATTPTPDRQGHIFEPLGASFTNPLPLLLHHDTKLPIGRVTLQRATAAGIAFTATLPSIAEAGPLKNRVDEAWQSIKAGILMGVSVGFRILDAMPSRKGDTLNLTKTEICELSLVTVPANMECTIRTVKSLDAPHLAAMGQTIPLRDGSTTPRKPIMTTPETIQQFENTRAAKVARMSSIMESAGTEATLDDESRVEYDDLSLEVKNIDGHLVRYRELEKAQASTATPIVNANGTKAAGDLRGGHMVVSVKDNAPKGQAFIRSVMTLVQAKGDSYRAFELAKQYRDPNVDLLVKAAVAPGSTLDPAWAQALVQINQLTGEFIEMSRPATILGKIPGLTKVPFNTQVPIQTGGGTYKWVGQAKAKPVGKLTFGTATLGMAKAAGIIVLTEELVKTSNPPAEEIVRRDMVAGIAQFLDQQFTDPTVAEVAQTSPASITNGATTAASLDDPKKDLGLIVGHFTTQNVTLKQLTIIMSQTNAYAMGLATNALGVPLYPGVGVDGGSANGLTVIASNVVGQNVIALAPEYILYADDGGVAIDVSREATLQMNDAPVTPADPATTVWTNMFQDNLVALRAERFINWKRAATNAVYYLTGAVYPI